MIMGTLYSAFSKAQRLNTCLKTDPPSGLTTSQLTVCTSVFKRAFDLSFHGHFVGECREGPGLKLSSELSENSVGPKAGAFSASESSFVSIEPDFFQAKGF